MTKQVIYAAPNFAELKRGNGYFIDKTEYIAKLERIQNPIFLRPRRFGKSFLCSLLHYYYDLHYKEAFDELFGDTWIGQHPTGKQNQLMVLHLNFSSIEPRKTLAEIEATFKSQCNYALHLLRARYAPLLDEMPPIDMAAPVSQNLANLNMYLAFIESPKLYVIIDEYDNFTNQLIVRYEDELYRQVTADDSFLKTFFKALKEGRERSAIDNVYITGILPITMDDLASAFNVASYLTLDPTFEAMVGFTQNEVDALLDEIFADHAFPAGIRADIDDLIKSNYNGYHFVRPSFDAHRVPIYNTTNLMYFLRYFVEHRQVPDLLIDLNLKTDFSWVKRLTASNPELTAGFVDEVAVNNVIQHDERFLVEKFNVEQFFDKDYFPISFFYLGMLTRNDDFSLKLPNLNMREIFMQYFNELHRVDVSSRYSDAMAAFVQQPDLEALFRCYWTEYVSQLPEAVFAQMNENFYRISFYELCSRYLSRWFTWNVERSYPKGKSDLEFVGKFHEKFAGLRWIIEFKYYSRQSMRSKKIDVKTFALQEEDAQQVRGYAEGLRKEQPEANISQFVIYCFANLDFRVYRV
jgi:hypothetical protein